MFTEPPKLSAPAPNVLCPRCGATQTLVTVQLRDPRTNKPIHPDQDRALTRLIPILSFPLLGYLSFSVIGPALWQGSANLSCCLMLSVLTAILAASTFWMTRRHDNALRVLFYICDACKHQWQSAQSSKALP